MKLGNADMFLRNLSKLIEYSKEIKKTYVPILNGLHPFLSGYAEHMAELLDDFIQFKKKGEPDLEPILSAIHNTINCFNDHKLIARISKQKIGDLSEKQKSAINYVNKAIDDSFYNEYDNDIYKAWDKSITI